jgi:hypothetical protein
VLCRSSTCNIGSNVCGHNENKWEGSDVVPVIRAVYASRSCNLVVLLFEGNELH